ncbi:MAG: phosphate/phosphite/phosphonate ABC transporter substrate-binding protein [Deltaproteobacteria bacterium]|nr:phosphate/phosphite/phosphonate ABC transporter substrate-binding protein [Deltaproteobacteria bacterium]
MSCVQKIIVIFCLSMGLVIGCNETESEPVVRPTEKRSALLIGLIPEHNIFKQIERYEPLAAYLSKRIGINIELKILTRYGNIIDNFISLGLDGAFFGSFTYALAHAKLGVEPVARPQSINGVSTYHGIIFVRQDSGIKGPEDMMQKRFAFVDKATTAGYVLPLAYFKQHGIKDYKMFLKETYFTGTHEDAIYDVINNKADIGAAKNTVFSRLAVEGSKVNEQLTILERSPEVPENGLAVRQDLDASLKDKLKQTLLNMHHDPAGIDILKSFGAEKFIETSDADYASVYEYAREIGLNLENYDYMND